MFEDGKLENTQLRVMEIAQRTEARRVGPDNRQGFRKLYNRDQSAAQAVWRGDTERLEIVQPGAWFHSRVSFHTLYEWQAGLLLLAIGLASGYTFHLKCGGGKNRGFGVLRSIWAEGIAADGKDWFWGRRQVVTQSQRQGWLEAYRRQVETWGIWDELPPILACLQEEYGDES
jgi:hypothetical protein